MKKILVIMEDDRVEKRLPGETTSDVGSDSEQTRVIVSRLIELEGGSVLEAVNVDEVVWILESRGEEVGAALVVEQEPGSRACLRHLEAIREKGGERIKVIGVAQTVFCMEQMEALRVWRLVGSPMGYIDIDRVLAIVREYIRE